MDKQDGQNKFIQILDCTIRDGGYVNNWHFDKVLVREVYRACSKAGVDFVEVGFRVGKKKELCSDCGPWRCVSDDLIAETITGLAGAKIAVMVNYGEADVGDFSDKEKSPVDLVRVAVHKAAVFGAIAFLKEIKKKGYITSLQLMAYATYTPKEIRDVVKALEGAFVDYVYVADSYGSVYPDQIKDFVSSLISVRGSKIGFHPHNNLQMSFANTLEAMRCGVHIVDSSFYGMGRGGGNLPTEILLSYLERQNHGKYNSIPVMNVVDQFFVDINAKNPWGYQVPYMLSGMFQLHPSYANKLVAMREYSMEDMWKALVFIQKCNPEGFSQSLLDDVIKKGIIRRLPDRIPEQSKEEIDGFLRDSSSESVQIPYSNRHQGKDFLVLANGPSLKKYKDQIDAFIEKFNPIILGANYIGELFVPHYHAFYNERRLIQYIDQVNDRSKLLLGQYVREDVIKDLVHREYERMFYCDSWDHSFDIKEGVIQSNCRTISVFLLGLAVVMGADRVFSVGMDGYQEIRDGSMLFYDEKDEKKDQDMIVERHYSCQKFLEEIDAFLRRQGKEGVHILTPTSYRGFYKGIENYI